MSIDRNWMTIGLGLSIILNIFLVGVISGHVFRREDGRRIEARPAAGALVPQVHVRALPKDERKLFNSNMAPHREGIRMARQQQQRLRQAAEADIAAPTFDKAKVAADLKALRDGNLALQEKVQDGLLDALAPLSQESRTTLVEHENASTGEVRDEHH